MSEDGEGLDDWEAAMAEQAEAKADDAEKVDPQDDIDAIMNEQAAGDVAQPAELDELREDASISVAEKKKLDTILDIPVTISMEVGRSDISIRNLLQLNQGSVVELDRVAGEPLDVLVNGTLVAHGEVVVINDKFGIRLTDVISQVERIKNSGRNLYKIGAYVLLLFLFCSVVNAEASASTPQTLQNPSSILSIFLSLFTGSSHYFCACTHCAPV